MTAAFPMLDDPNPPPFQPLSVLIEAEHGGAAHGGAAHGGAAHGGAAHGGAAHGGAAHGGAHGGLSPAIATRRTRIARHLARPGVLRSVVLAAISLGVVGAGVVAAAASRVAPGAAGQGAQPALVDTTDVPPPAPGEPYTFAGLDIHPDRLFGTYFAGAFGGGAAAGVGADFRWRLDMFRKAYGEDDNFTIRVLDERTGQTLQTLTLQAARDRFTRGGQAEWDAVNRERTAATSALRAKWLAYGVPQDKITIRWGYRDQTLEARDRDTRYVNYEVNLARRLGLSVLATEIGTVETFNQDGLVSSAGARSRYQMMPDVLRRFDIEQYTVPTAGGPVVAVKEELNPLLAMEPSLMFVRAYANAVGHELPGISAYHTGPGNIFALYREYLRAFPGLRRAQGRHVSDAYMWGVTDGFERVDAVSSFGMQSRVYVLKAYGALRATETLTVDPAQTARGELVRLTPGAAVTLEQMLVALAPHEARLDWGPVRGASLYEKFRDLNPHMSLPFGASGVPTAGNVRFASSVGTVPVRFFLPLGATAVLRGAGLDVVGSVQRFDQNTYLVSDGERLDVDRDYDALVEETGRFGFTQANKARLGEIAARLSAEARRHPESRFRRTQSEIARIHQQVWNTRAFDDLAAVTATLFSSNPLVRLGREPVAAAPPVSTLDAAPDTVGAVAR